MKIYRLRSLYEYKIHIEKMKDEYAIREQYESAFSNQPEKEFTVRGISYPANQYVDFHVDFLYSDGSNINWRERLICPITKLNNRLRSSVQVMDMELGAYSGSRIYITEQVTPLFSFLQKRFPAIVGSEYLGNDMEPGAIKDDIKHEDMTNLSFANESFEYYLSYECFEHIPSYKKAITETYRVLKPGGVFLGTFPFDRNARNNLIKAKIGENGETVFLMEPEYHGDPVNDKGILCYTIFGWEVLEEFRQAGFRDVYCIFLWSDVFGYLGGEQIFLFAKK